MSKVGKAPIPIPDQMDIEVKGETVCVSTEDGRQKCQPFDGNYVTVEKKDAKIVVNRLGDSKPYRERHGLYRSLIADMLEGLEEPFEKNLQIEGLGYRARVQGQKIILELGFSHPVEYELPENINAEVEDKTRITIKGPDKQTVGQVAADIRNFRPPEPYKGKGIRYKGEEIIRKEGKLSGGEEAGIG